VRVKCTDVVNESSANQFSTELSNKNAYTYPFYIDSTPYKLERSSSSRIESRCWGHLFSVVQLVKKLYLGTAVQHSDLFELLKLLGSIMVQLHLSPS
jgi:hypothetical protein